MAKFDIGSVRETLGSGNGCPFYGLTRTHAMVEAYGLNLDPDYQRGHVWTFNQQAKFIGHLIEGGTCANPIINTGPEGKMLYGLYKNGDPASEILDGKQRITAMLYFSDGKIPARLTDGRNIYVNDMNALSQTSMRMSIGVSYQIVELTREKCLHWYIKLNRGGTVHTDAEIERVRSMLAIAK